ncbi:hypothetical protein D3C71_1324650 [compost metagenome]
MFENRLTSIAEGNIVKANGTAIGKWSCSPCHYRLAKQVYDAFTRLFVVPEFSIVGERRRQWIIDACADNKEYRQLQNTELPA